MNCIHIFIFGIFMFFLGGAFTSALTDNREEAVMFSIVGLLAITGVASVILISNFT